MIPGMNKSTAALASLALGCLLLSADAVAQARAGWTLVWADEFTQADGSSPDPAKWVFDTGATGWGNRELQYYTSRLDNVRVEKGLLVLEAKRESYQGSEYTSGRLKTLGKASWTYGRVEARIKIPRTQGIWPAFWMLGANIDSARWPTCGEIDIMENIGREPGVVHGTLHGPGYSGGAGIGGPFSLPGGGAFADDFHVYAVEWTPDRIAWFVDDRQYFTVTPPTLPAGAKWVFDRPQFILLNVAVGGNWPGYPDATTVLPQRMLVDYVRVYAPAASSTTQRTPLNEPR
jgi:beta-glucanase (GH16 family)